VSAEEESPRPPRRKRYSGKNPRRFEDKYKELNPLKYSDTVAKVIASGKTPAGTHIPVLMEECMTALRLKPGMVGVDATLGYGGHASRILKMISPGGKLIGFDQDPIELPKTIERLRQAGFDASCFEGVRSNYAGITKVLADVAPDGVDFIFADLGCSSMQLDDPQRGFSFKQAGPLDMRMNPNKGLSASEWLLRVSAEKLAQVLDLNADEPRADTLASALAGKHFQNTIDLVNAIRQSFQGEPDDLDLTVRRVFQAVRIAVNEEFVALDTFLRMLPEGLKSGGVAAILTFHSGEDRRVKKALKDHWQKEKFSEWSDGVISANFAERHANPRSIPAKLRWAIKR
jgi:16S rRNA (cytosine1402-N4)-methyltransferase